MEVRTRKNEEWNDALREHRASVEAGRGKPLPLQLGRGLEMAAEFAEGWEDY